MKNGFFLLIGLLLGGILASCDETNEIDEYANWKVRNERFLDSIAEVAKANPDEWKVIRTYTQSGSQSGSGNVGGTVEGEVDDYIYVKVIQSAVKLSEANGGLGEEACREVLYTDSVYVNYKGTLINDVVFDKSFSTPDLDYAVATPVVFGVNNSSLIAGFVTALQQMREGDHSLEQWQYKGDRWEVYIPYNLGYGTKDNSSIPACSLLKFDLALVGVWGLGEDKPAWN